MDERELWYSAGGGGCVRLIAVAPDVYRFEIEDGNKKGASPFDFGTDSTDLLGLRVALDRELGQRSFHDDVAEFHRAMGLVVARAPRLLPPESYARRVRLIAEEFAELTRAHAAGDVVEFADAVADLAWITLGTGVEAGLPMNAVWAEVRRANMAKVGGRLDSSGKLQKPPGWAPPDVAGVLALGR